MEDKLRKIRFEIIKELRDSPAGQRMAEDDERWEYPSGAVIELKDSVYSDDDIPEVKRIVRKPTARREVSVEE